MAHQWPDGMVPHIIFHEHDDGYFPNAAVWGTDRPTPTSGITQPPVAGFVLADIIERVADSAPYLERARALTHQIHRWHQWFATCRADGTGLIAIVHPWESGRDNSIDWDEAFERVPTEGVQPFTRRDTSHANPKHRPTDDQYKRYIWLVQQFRNLGWDNRKIAEQSKFQVIDPGFNAIMIRSCLAIENLARKLGETAVSAESAQMAERMLQSLEGLWSESLGQFVCHDRITDKPINSPSIGGLIPICVPIDMHHAEAINTTITTIGGQAKYLVPSHRPDSAAFDELRYWRGPVWLIVNYLIANGLSEHGHRSLGQRIVQDSLELIHEGGFAEYYGCHTGTPCGGDTFTWTAAMVLEFLNHPEGYRASSLITNDEPAGLPGDRSSDATISDATQGDSTLRRMTPADASFERSIEDSLTEWGSDEDNEAFRNL